MPISSVRSPQETILKQAETVGQLQEEAAWLKKQLFRRKPEQLVDIATEQSERGIELDLRVEQPVEEAQVAPHSRQAPKPPERFEIPEYLAIEMTVFRCTRRGSRLAGDQ